MRELVTRLAGRAAPAPVAALDAAALDTQVAGLAQAVACADGRLDDAVLADVRGVVARVEERRQLSGRLTVVALAGSTGAGKSTLFNALVGAEVAVAGVRRPTTSAPLAAAWESSTEVQALLDWMEVGRTHVVDVSTAADDGSGVLGSESAALADVVLVDLPDHDSTEAAHRATVDRLLARVDVMVWVLDPQKYADALVHEDYLRRYARHGEVTVVVLNQMDRLTVAEADACIRHLRALVAADGLPTAPVLGVSARTGQGMTELADAIGAVVASRRAALARSAADVATAADALAAAASDSAAAVAGADGRAEAVLTDLLTEAAGAQVVATAVADSRRRGAALAVGWPPLRWVARLRPDPVVRWRLDRSDVAPELVRTSLPGSDPVAAARARTAVLTYADTASQGAPRAWVDSTRDVAESIADSLPDALDRAVTRAPLVPARDPRWWRVVGGLQWGLLTLAVVGAGWLLLLAVLGYLQFDVPTPPKSAGVPVPTLLLIVGLLGGIVLAAGARLLAGRSATRAAAAARKALRAEVQQVAVDNVVTPVRAELATLEQFRAALQQARGQHD